MIWGRRRSANNRTRLCSSDCRNRWESRRSEGPSVSSSLLFLLFHLFPTLPTSSSSSPSFLPSFLLLLLCPHRPQLSFIHPFTHHRYLSLNSLLSSTISPLHSLHTFHLIYIHIHPLPSFPPPPPLHPPIHLPPPPITTISFTFTHPIYIHPTYTPHFALSSSPSSTCLYIISSVIFYALYLISLQ